MQDDTGVPGLTYMYPHVDSLKQEVRPGVNANYEFLSEMDISTQFSLHFHLLCSRNKMIS